MKLTKKLTISTALILMGLATTAGAEAPQNLTARPNVGVEHRRDDISEKARAQAAAGDVQNLSPAAGEETPAETTAEQPAQQPEAPAATTEQPAQ